MGCRSVKDNLESEMLYLKLERILIRQERNKIIKKYFERTGEMLERKVIPDYLAPDGTQKANNEGDSQPKENPQNVQPQPQQKKNIKGTQINIAKKQAATPVIQDVDVNNVEDLMESEQQQPKKKAPSKKQGQIPVESDSPSQPPKQPANKQVKQAAKKIVKQPPPPSEPQEEEQPEVEEEAPEEGAPEEGAPEEGAAEEGVAEEEAVEEEEEEEVEGEEEEDS